MAKKVLFNSETNVFDPIMWIRSHYCGPENCQKDMDEMVQWSMDTIHRMFVGGMPCRQFNMVNLFK